MKLKKLDPHSPEVVNAALDMMRGMTPEEALKFFTYRAPGVEETDMTGMYDDARSSERPLPVMRRVASA